MSFPQIASTLGRFRQKGWDARCVSRNATLLLAMLVSQLTEPTAAFAQPGNQFLSGLDLLPPNAAGLVRVLDMPQLCQAWQATTLSGLRDEPSLQPLIEANFGVDGAVWKQISERVGIRPKDLLEIGRGEVVAAWLASPENQRHPSSLAIIADVRGNRPAAQAMLDRIDGELKDGGATRIDVTHAGTTVRVYRPQQRPGQLLIQQVAITLTDDRVIAADLDVIVNGILDAIGADGLDESLAESPQRQRVMEKSYERIEPAVANQSLVEWFALPLPMGRIVRDIAKVDRGSKVKIIDLLERQGFDALEAIGGVVVVGGPTFDLVHRGYVHAPPVPGEPDRYQLAARMLDFPNSPLLAIPPWVPDGVASFTRINWKLEEAFWASETLVNEALDSNIFRPSIEGIRDDEEGPQIDLENEVLPYLDDHLVILTDNTLPATIDSERLLVAVRVSDAKQVGEAVRKAMEVEPDVFKVEDIAGVDIWKVQRGEGESDNSEFFDDLGFDDIPEDEAPPLLNTWALAMVPKGKNSDSAYLLFASHVELLEEVARMMNGDQRPALSDDPEATTLQETLAAFGADEVAVQRLVRLRYSLRAKYELLRKGELKESDSISATLIRRLLENQQQREEELDRPNQAKWPAFELLEPYFRNAAGFVQSTDEGWTLNGFLLR